MAPGAIRLTTSGCEWCSVALGDYTVYYTLSERGKGADAGTRGPIRFVSYLCVTPNRRRNEYGLRQGRSGPPRRARKSPQWVRILSMKSR
jgi:hypothetical protein